MLSQLFQIPFSFYYYIIGMVAGVIMLNNKVKHDPRYMYSTGREKLEMSLGFRLSVGYGELL